MESISPVFTEKEVQFEQRIAEHQAEYMTVIGLPVTLMLIDRESGKQTLVNPWGMSFRFRLSDEERAAVAEGKDLILTQLNFGKPVTPMNVQFCGVNEKPCLGEVPPTPVAEPEMNATMIDEARVPSAADLDVVEQERAIAEATGPQLVIAEDFQHDKNCPGCEYCNPEGASLPERVQGDGFTE